MYINKGIQTKNITANFSLQLAYNQILANVSYNLNLENIRDKINSNLVHLKNGIRLLFF